MMRYELNFDEDKVNDVLDKDGASYDLKGCCKIMNGQQKTIKKQGIEIQSLNLHIEKLVGGDEISQLLMREYERSDGLEKENERLKQELRGMGELLKSYRKTIKHDAELLADASKNGYLPPLNDYVSIDGWICGCCKHFHSGVRDRCDKDNNWVLKVGYCQDFENSRAATSEVAEELESFKFNKNCAKPYEIRSVSQNGAIRVGKKNSRVSYRMKDVREISAELPPFEDFNRETFMRMRNKFRKFDKDILGRIIYNIYIGTFEEYI